MRRTLIVWAGSGPYHVPTLARVALFPIHLDPPTRQHRELFRLLLGAPDLATASPQVAPGSSSSTTIAAMPTSLPTSADAPASNGTGLRGRFHGFLQRRKGAGETSAVGDSALSSSGLGAGTGSMGMRGFPGEDPMSSGCSSPFWYMEAFATSLHEDSQLAPFDDIILIPNTRGPVSLRQSTHLAALAVLATRGLAHVHVDFTALEHPDESMPIVYELVCKYTNSVLVHWLQDAYEMQNWSHFAEFKSTVPMLLLQTQSYPPRALERQRPLGSVSRLTSRQYQSPVGPYVRSPEEAEYYRRAERFINASTTMRQHNPGSAALACAADGYVDTGMRERYESASLVNRESDYFDDVPDVPPNRRRADEEASAAAWQEDVSDTMRGTPPPKAHERVFARSPLLRGGQTATRTSSISRDGSGKNNNSSAARRSAVVGHDRLGLSYADCAKGRWWNTPGGRGDDEVELSRAYWSSTSSSWLGGGGVGASSALPEWMEEVGAATAKLRNYRRFTEDHATPTNISDPAFAEDDGSAPVESVPAAAVTPEADHDTQSVDTVVSDDGFALAVEGQTGGAGNVAETSPSKNGNTTAKTAATAAGESATASRAAAARESADDDTRERLLTREIEDVRRMLDGLLRPTSTTTAVAGSATTTADSASNGAAASMNTKSTSSSSTPLSLPRGTATTTTTTTATAAATPSNADKPVRSSDATDAPGGTLGRSFGAYEAHHHDTQSHTRRRHCTVRHLIEELYPPRVYGPAPSTTAGPAAIGATEDGLHEFYRAGGSRSTSSGSLFNTAVKTSPTHLGFMQQAATNRDNGNSNGGSNSSSNNGTGGAVSSNLYSWIDSPMVEVHPITRSTGADVRQALWEQEIHPSSILTGCVQRYMEGHGLYRDPRKATAASLYAGVGASDFGSTTRGVGGGIGGPGGQLGAAPEIGGGFRDPATAGSGSAGGGSGTAVGNTILDGRTGVRRVAPRDTSTLSFPGLIPRLELHYDRNNLLAREQFEKLRIFQCQDGEEPDLIVPIGGDGYMMHCIRKNWRRFIPFYGVNAGHVGYLLNDRSTLEELFSSPLKLHFTTMLYCQAEKEGDTGERMLLSELAFNDAWVERSSGQTALIRILVNGQERIRRLRGDGVLVSTAAGSTAYSQALGASPVPVGAPLIQVVGSNVVSPAQWRPAHLDQEDQVEFEVIDSTKRPCRCYVDSVDVGNVTRLLVRSSRVAGVTLAFSKSCDLQHKLYQMQFPKTL